MIKAILSFKKYLDYSKIIMVLIDTIEFFFERLEQIDNEKGTRSSRNNRTVSSTSEG